MNSKIVIRNLLKWQDHKSPRNHEEIITNWEKGILLIIDLDLGKGRFFSPLSSEMSITSGQDNLVGLSSGLIWKGCITCGDG